MLGNDVLSVRLGGIYALEHLAREHPDQYHLQIVKLLCAFVRNPPREGGIETTPSEGKGRKLRGGRAGRYRRPRREGPGA